MRKILFVNACVRKESRTRKLAEHYLSYLEGEIEEVRLETCGLRNTTEEDLKKRDEALANGTLDQYREACQFAEADEIVIAAPYWDYSYPASVKTYIENVNIYGVTFRYANNAAVGLCKAQRLVYIMTAGSPVGDFDFGFKHIEALCHTFYHIPEVVEFKAEGLDIEGADVEAIMNQARRDIDAYFVK